MSRYSVIIATHDRADWLARAVRSVKAQAQPVDLIIVADLVSPRTQALVLPLLSDGDVFVQRWGAAGPAESRNLGLRLVRSQDVLFLDDDDEWAPDFLAQLDAHRPPGHTGLLYTDFRIVKHGATPEARAESAHSLAGHRPEDLYVRNFIPNSCLVYPAALLGTRRYDPRLTLNEDWDFLLNAMGGGGLTHVPVVGPIIHKTEAPRRGNSNDHLLIETYVTVYRSWPAPTEALKQARQALLAANGVTLPLSAL